MHKHWTIGSDIATVLSWALEAEGGVVNFTQKLSHDSRDILMKIGQSNDILHSHCDSLCIIV